MGQERWREPSARRGRRWGRAAWAAAATLAIAAAGCTDDDAAQPLAPGGSSATTGGSTVSVSTPGTGGGGGEDGGGGQEGGDPWTLLLYTTADTNIESSLLTQITAAATGAGSTDSVNIVLLVDRTPDDTGDANYPDDNLGSIPNFDSAKLLEVRDGDFAELADLGEIDMGDPQTLAWFIQTGIAQFPAQRYGLVLLDHGGAIFGFGWDDTAPADSGGEASHLTIPEMGDGIAAGLAAADVDQLEFLGFHACLLATYDLAATVAPYARWMVASEEVVWGETWAWNPAMAFLADNPTATGRQLGQLIVDNSIQPGFPPIVTMSLLDLTKVGALEQAVRSLAQALTDDIEAVAPELGRQRELALEFGRDPGQAHSPFAAVDLGDLVRRLENVPPAVATARSAVFTALENVVVGLIADEAAAQATGLTIYFPPTADGYDRSYNTINSAAPWRTMLDAYYQVAVDTSDEGGAPAFESPQADLQVSADGVVVSARLVSGTERSVVFAELITGVLNADGGVTHLLILPATVGAGDPRVIAGGWGFGYTTVSDGLVTLDTTTFLEPVAGGIRASIPMLYQAVDGSQEEVILTFTLDDQTGELTEPPRYFIFLETGGLSQLVPDPGSLVAPLVLVSAPGAGGPEFQLIGDQGLDATVVPTLAIIAPPSGTTFHVALLAGDAADNIAVATGLGTIP